MELEEERSRRELEEGGRRRELEEGLKFSALPLMSPDCEFYRKEHTKPLFNKHPIMNVHNLYLYYLLD